MLYSPFLLGLFNVEFSSVNENRRLAKRPSFSLERITTAENIVSAMFEEIISYKNRYNIYYKDHFIFKRQLFKIYSFIQADIYHRDPLPEKIVSGKNGWHFLGDSNSNVVKMSRGISVFNKDEIAVIKNNIEGISKKMKSLNIHYYLAIAPNKHSVHGDSLFAFNYMGETCLKQVIKETSKCHILISDLGEDFKNKNGRLFLKNDSHWNDQGAYYGYLNLLSKIKKDFPEVKILSMNELEKSTSISEKGDLIKLLDIEAEELRINFTVKNPQSVKQDYSTLEVPPVFNAQPNIYEMRYSSPVNDLKVVVFRDSFSEALIPFLRESFGETVFVWRYQIEWDFLLREKPDLVIHQLVERNIGLLKRLKTE